MIYASHNLLCVDHTRGLRRLETCALYLPQAGNMRPLKKEVRRPDAAERGSAHREGWDISFFAFSPLPYRPGKGKMESFCLGNII